jgi:hypothetical protein
MTALFLCLSFTNALVAMGGDVEPSAPVASLLERDDLDDALNASRYCGPCSPPSSGRAVPCTPPRAHACTPPTASTSAFAPAPTEHRFQFLRNLCSETRDALLWKKPDSRFGHSKPEEALRFLSLFNLIDGLIEWRQCLADIPRLGATTPDLFYHSAAHESFNSVIAIVRNGLKAISGYIMASAGSDCYVGQVVRVGGGVLTAATVLNALHSLLRYKDISLSALNVQLFTAYNNRLTAEQKDRLAAIQSQLRAKANLLKAGLKQLATLRHAKDSSLPIWLLNGDVGSSIYLRTLKANYMRTVLAEARTQYTVLVNLDAELTERIRKEYMMPERLQRLQRIHAETKLLLDYVRGQRTEDMLKSVLVFEGESLDNDVLNSRIAQLRGATDRER